MCGSMVDIQSPTAEIISRGIYKDRRKIETTGKNIMSASATQVAIINMMKLKHKARAIELI